MALKKFDSFETSLEEDSLKMESMDAAGAKKQLLSSFEKHSKTEFSTKSKHMVWDLGDNKLLLATGHDKGVVVQVLGFEKNIGK